MHWLTEMGMFAKVVELGGIGKAAQQLGVTRSAVSKHVSRLEAGLGVKLLHRTTRAMSLTDAGLVVYEQCARMLAAAEEAEAAATRLAIAPRGLLKISTTVAYGHGVVLPRLAEFLQRYPEVVVELDLLDRNVDLAYEGYDLVLRLTDHPPEGLAARRLAVIRHILCASPAYLARSGRPQVPDDLLAHNCLRHTQPGPCDEWRFLGAEGVVKVKISGNAIVSSSVASRTLALAGVGCGLLPDYMVKAEIEAGRLIPLLPDYPPIGGYGHLFALYLPTRQGNHKVRAFIDWMLETVHPTGD
ncbi:MAG TPA: LysR family transcriptional regulator [Gammaproteobacteria bacterium]